MFKPRAPFLRGRNLRGASRFLLFSRDAIRLTRLRRDGVVTGRLFHRESSVLVLLLLVRHRIRDFWSARLDFLDNPTRRLPADVDVREHVRRRRRQQIVSIAPPNFRSHAGFKRVSRVVVVVAAAVVGESAAAGFKQIVQAPVGFRVLRVTGAVAFHVDDRVADDVLEISLNRVVNRVGYVVVVGTNSGVVLFRLTSFFYQS